MKRLLKNLGQIQGTPVFVLKSY